MIDSHCHVGIGADADKGSALEAVLKRAEAAGVQKLLTVACRYADVKDLKAMTDKPDIFGAFGIHPENAEEYREEKSRAVFQELPELAAVGEIGLDYYYNADTAVLQRDVFEKQLDLASALKLPVIIHTRAAEEDTLHILRAAFKGGLLKAGGVLHCFTGSLKLAEEALDMGFYISASGIITFKNAAELCKTFESVPLNRLLIETDSPYLAPIPYRGKTNEPAYVVETLKRLAYIKNKTVAETEEITSANFNRLFLKGKRNEN